MTLPLSLSLSGRAAIPGKERKVKNVNVKVKVEGHWGYMSKQLGGDFP